MATDMALVESDRMDEQRESERRELETLDPEECMMLLATVPVGRVAFCVNVEPRIEVINFVVDDGSVLVRMASSKTAAVGRGASFALEANRLDRPWAPGDRPYLARLTPQRVFGRRLRALPAFP